MTIFCDDTPDRTTGRRRLLLTAPVVEVYGSICSVDPTAAIIQGQKTGELRGSCVPETEVSTPGCPLRAARAPGRPATCDARPLADPLPPCPSARAQRAPSPPMP